MYISLEEKGRNQAHVDFEIKLDGVVSGLIRLWAEEEDKFQLFVAKWNERNQRGVKRLESKF